MLVTVPVRIPRRAGQHSKSTNLPKGLFCASCPVARLDISECGREEDAPIVCRDSDPTREPPHSLTTDHWQTLPLRSVMGNICNSNTQDHPPFPTKKKGQRCTLSSPVRLMPPLAVLDNPGQPVTGLVHALTSSLTWAN